MADRTGVRGGDLGAIRPNVFVTGRVVQAITGPASWRLDVAGAVDRHGSGYGTGMGSVVHGVTGQPQAYYGGTSLLLTGEGGSFTGGVVRLAVHLMEILPHASA